MIFSSITFIFWFIPIFFAAYYVVPQKFRNTVLFLGSIVFYAWGEPKYLILIFISILANYIAGIMLKRAQGVRDANARTDDNHSLTEKIILIAALAFDFGMLAVFKYTGFFITNINSIFGVHVSVPSIVLPLGISFYTFQIASYIIDLYNGKIEAESNIIVLGTYIMMFPQLIAGPIVVYKHVNSRLHDRSYSMKAFEDGIGIFILGLSSKVLIANNVGMLWDELFDIGIENISMPLAWLGVVAYSLQIYFDFNGYSLMAIGLGRMLGFDFPQNFNYPYISRSLTEFWRRWHITLSSWFREYVYIPLGGSRKGKIRTYVNLFIVWFLTGFWHGAGWNFILWGLFFFVMLSLEKLMLTDFLAKHVVISRVYSLLFIGLSWMIFAITDMANLGAYFGRLVCCKWGSDIVYYGRNYLVVILLGIVLSTPALSKLFAKLPKLVRSLALCILLILSVSYLADASYNPFLYFRF